MLRVHLTTGKETRRSKASNHRDYESALFYGVGQPVFERENLFVTVHGAADRLSLVYKQPMCSEAFLWLKMAFEYSWLESILITTPWQRRYLFANLTIVTFFTITLFSFEVDCQGFQTRPGAKVQLYRPSNLLF